MSVRGHVGRDCGAVVVVWQDGATWRWRYSALNGATGQREGPLELACATPFVSRQEATESARTA